VELTDKSSNRLRSILALHAGWIAARKTDAVIYACSSESGAERVVRHGRDIGLSEEDRTLRVETLDTIRRATVPLSGHDRPAQALAASGRWRG
jgi:hypothetical protein